MARITKKSTEDARDNSTDRSVVTRNKIMEVAVRLFAERGIDGVSLNDITKAAGQRNKNATHYHFGSKEGLLQAILDKYEPRITARRDELLDDYEARGELTLRNVVRSMIYPLVEKLSDFEGGRNYIRFSAHMVVHHTMTAVGNTTPRFQMSSVARLVKAFNDAMETELPDALKLQRGLLIGMLLTHSLAEHSRMLDAGGNIDKALRTELFVSNLEDCCTALLQAGI